MEIIDNYKVENPETGKFEYRAIKYKKESGVVYEYRRIREPDGSISYSDWTKITLKQFIEDKPI